MALQSKIRELKEKREKLFLGGGEQAIEKQKALGKRTARERIMSLLDDDSFNEYDLFVEHDARDFDMDKKSLPTDGVIIGTGTIYGAPIAVFAQDFTVAGGSLGLMRAAQALAAIRGRSYVLPDDVKLFVRPALIHRLILEPDLWMTRQHGIHIQFGQ